MKAEGRPSKLRHAGPHHTDMRFPAPRTISDTLFAKFQQDDATKSVNLGSLPHLLAGPGLQARRLSSAPNCFRNSRLCGQRNETELR